MRISTPKVYRFRGFFCRRDNKKCVQTFANWCDLAFECEIIGYSLQKIAGFWYICRYFVNEFR